MELFVKVQVSDKQTLQFYLIPCPITDLHSFR